VVTPAAGESVTEGTILEWHVTVGEPVKADATIVEISTDKVDVELPAPASGVVTELPRSTRLGPATGMWHRIPAGSETLRVHRRFFKDIETADSVSAAA